MSDPAAPQADPANLAFRIAGQYVKDLSFENPRAPAVFNEMTGAPPVQISVGVAVNQIGERVYEVVLNIAAEAKSATDKLFVVELAYAGLVETQTQQQPETLAPFLMIEIPRHLFPFARAIVSSATRDGGFPPLMLAPVDFVALYRQRAQESAAAAAPGAAAPATQAKPA